MYSRSISAWNVRTLLKEWFPCDIGMLQTFRAFTALHSIAFRRMSLYFWSKLKSDPEPTLQARTSAYPNLGIWLILIVDRGKSCMIFDMFDAFDKIWHFLSSEFDGGNVPFDQFYFAWYQTHPAWRTSDHKFRLRFSELMIPWSLILPCTSSLSDAYQALNVIGAAMYHEVHLPQLRIIGKTWAVQAFSGIFTYSRGDGQWTLTWPIQISIQRIVDKCWTDNFVSLVPYSCQESLKERHGCHLLSCCFCSWHFGITQITYPTINYWNLNGDKVTKEAAV